MRYLVLAVSVAMIMIPTFEMGKMAGYLQGKTDALATNPVSEELDLVCAGLWVGEQNKQYLERKGAK